MSIMSKGKNNPFYFIFILAICCIMLVVPLVLPGCSGDDDDDNDNNDDVTGDGISGTWDVILTIQIDTCYGLTSGTTLEDTWIITQDDTSINLIDGEGDSFSGTYQNNMLAASFEGTMTEGSCTMELEILISAHSNNEENVMSGTMSAMVEALTPTECGFENCATANTIVATKR